MCMYIYIYIERERGFSLRRWPTKLRSYEEREKPASERKREAVGLYLLK